METSRPGYYAVIPADVRYDDRIPANAKLLYGEISALIGSDGYCYASNQYFSGLYGMAEETIARLITKLEQAGHIIRVLERDHSGQIKIRKLYLRASIPVFQPLDEKINTSPQKNQEGIDEKVKDTNLSKTNNTPYSPPQGDPAPRKKSKRECKATADVLPERFEGFWKYYREGMPEGSSAGSRQKAIRAWDKLAPDDDLVRVMANSLWKQVRTKAWASGVGVPHASTWLNNRGWEDDWGPIQAQNGADPGGEARREGEWL